LSYCGLLKKGINVQRTILSGRKKISATISAFIFSLSFLSIPFVVAPSANAWTSSQIAVSVFGGSANDFSESIAVDSTGNIYTTGSFQGTADFDPGTGTFNLTSTGGADVFVSKLDPSGNLLWAKNLGGSSNDIGFSIAVDSSGNVYTTGYFSNPGADFDPSAQSFSLRSAGGDDIFVSKLDPSGNLIWAKGFGGSSTDLGYEIAVDSTGNVYATGYFEGTSDFDPSAGAFNLTSNGERDVFVLKVNPSGDLLWAKNFGGVNTETGYSLAVDGTGNVYTTGTFEFTADFDPGAATTNLSSAGGSDVFVSKLDSSGNLIWAKRFGGSSDDSGRSIAVDSSGNVYTTGYFQGTVDFDPGAATTNLTSAGSDDIFISQLDLSGNLIWAKRIGGSGVDNGNSIAVDSTGNVYTTGLFSGTADFDPGAVTFNLTTAGQTDAFVSKLDPSGNLLWAKRIGGSSVDHGDALAVNSTGNIYTAGRFYATADFDPSEGTTNLTPAGGVDVFLLKLTPSGDAQASAAPSAPTLNSLTGGDRRVTISFTAGANNGSAITDYEYSFNGSSYISAGTTTSPFTITGLNGRTTYSVTIKARNSAGLSAASSSLSVTTTDSSLDASEAATEVARVAAAQAEAARKAREHKELTEILALIPKIGELTLSLGETTKSLYSTKCVKGKSTKFVKKGAKCPKGFVKRK
jgi:alpha-tubulin suppressor-like RCC1 family protein